ncbi:MAG: rhodanese-like domain-containing protein [Gammaproteobacteria bacterium]|nr:rhodanese-like domain-containing protein [Gammaproteobacteria bacterium]
MNSGSGDKRVAPKTLEDFIREARARIQEIHPDELDEMIENHDDLLIVDVREPDEYGKGHIPGALLVPRGTLEGAADPGNGHRIEPLCSARDRTIIVYCDTGARSALAADTLTQMGFNSYNLAGGLVLWEADDFPVIRD